MELTEFLGLLVSHNATNKGYQIQLNSGNLENKSNKNTGVEFSDLYFTECSTLRNTTLLCFGNSNRKPISQKEDGTNLYPMEINSQMFIDISKIEAIEDVKDFEDWFNFPSEKVINIYMFPENENMNGCRNVITVGLME
ncbi:MAG: hypothetical protein IJE43_03025 [Alphaproteobacteria bacterium]|nr:hypothetical protein [Alphaproteobacteria bacterium]MBQ6886262.1 hypothetical protein [Lachnospiraceae bacterium]